MLDIDIKYPVMESVADDQKSILDLRKQGMVEDPNAVIMRDKNNLDLFYFLITDHHDGVRKWLPLRTD